MWRRLMFSDNIGQGIPYNVKEHCYLGTPAGAGGRCLTCVGNRCPSWKRAPEDVKKTGCYGFVRAVCELLSVIARDVDRLRTRLVNDGHQTSSKPCIQIAEFHPYHDICERKKDIKLPTVALNFLKGIHKIQTLVTQRTENPKGIEQPWNEKNPPVHTVHRPPT